MNTRKWMGFKIVFIILCLLLGQRLTSGQHLTFGQSLTEGQEVSGASAREYSGADVQAEYQSYLPLMIRQVFVESKGELDPSFGEDGIVITDFSYLDSSFAWDVLVQPDGKVVAVGSSDIGDGYDQDFALARYHPPGSLDERFGYYGQVLTDISETNSESASAMVLQRDGKIFLSGWSSDGYDINFIVLRYK